MTNAHQQRGFTLLETILSLALTALIVGMIATMARQWLANWSLGSEKIEQMEAVLLAEDRIARDLAGARAVMPYLANAKPSLFGSDRDITFIREPSKADGTDHLIVIQYRSDAERGITRRVAVYDAEKPIETLTFSEPVRLLPPPYQFKFEYRNAEGATAANWQNRMMPASAMVTLSLHDGRSFTAQPIDIRAPLPTPCARVERWKECENIMKSGKWPQGKQTQSKDGNNGVNILFKDNTKVLKP